MPRLLVESTPLVELAPGVFARRPVDQSAGSAALTIGEMIIEPGAPPRVRHRHRVEEGIIVREGTGRFRLDDEEWEVGPGTMVLVPAGAVHGMTNIGSTQLRTYFVYPAVTVAREDVVEA